MTVAPHIRSTTVTTPTTQQGPLAHINIFTPKPGMMDEFVTVQLQGLASLGDIAGSRGSRMFRANDNRHAILIALFVDEASHRRFMASPAFIRAPAAAAGGNCTRLLHAVLCQGQRFRGKPAGKRRTHGWLDPIRRETNCGRSQSIRRRAASAIHILHARRQFPAT
jgi:hypothetical protein